MGKRFALVGDLAVSIRAEVRFTRDVDLAIAVSGDPEVEQLVHALRLDGYRVLAVVEHDVQRRVATVRLGSPSGVVVDLLTASSGIEPEVVARATPVLFEEVGEIRVARSEELLAMKVLAYTERRLQDRIDAINLLAFNPDLDLQAVRNNLELIRERGFDRSEALGDKLDRLLQEAK